jgi:ketosteroid isomerase-like protein
VDHSPLATLLEAVDRLDLDGASALFAEEVQVMLVDGRRAEGIASARQLLGELIDTLRCTSHRITDQWQFGDVWVAEVEADYERKDRLQLTALPRAFVLRTSAERITDVRVYGARERPLTDYRTGEEGMWIDDRWIPPL